MSRFRLLTCYFVFLLSCGAVAAKVGATENKVDEMQGHKQEKFAGRADNLASVNDAQSKDRTSSFAQAHEKKPLSQEEKRNLRRQINETEIRYPKKD